MSDPLTWGVGGLEMGGERKKCVANIMVISAVVMTDPKSTMGEQWGRYQVLREHLSFGFGIRAKEREDHVLRSREGKQPE